MTATVSPSSAARPMAEWFGLSGEETCQPLDVDPAIGLSAARILRCVQYQAAR